MWHNFKLNNSPGVNIDTFAASWTVVKVLTLKQLYEKARKSEKHPHVGRLKLKLVLTKTVRTQAVIKTSSFIHPFVTHSTFPSCVSFSIMLDPPKGSRLLKMTSCHHTHWLQSNRFVHLNSPSVAHSALLSIVWQRESLFFLHFIYEISD